jgi:hypothetical protein
MLICFPTVFHEHLFSREQQFSELNILSCSRNLLLFAKAIDVVGRVSETATDMPHTPYPIEQTQLYKPAIHQPHYPCPATSAKLTGLRTATQVSTLVPCAEHPESYMSMSGTPVACKKYTARQSGQGPRNGGQHSYTHVSTQDAAPVV